MAKQSKALVKEAEALGIDVDGRWGDETIQEKIDEREAAIAATDQANAGTSPDGDPVAKQVEALTDGEGDPATSGEAGVAAGTSAEGEATVEGAVADGEAAGSVGPHVELAAGADPAGGLQVASEIVEERTGRASEDAAAPDMTDDPVADAEDAPDDDAEEGEAVDLGDGSAAGEELPIFATNAYQSLKAPIRAALDAADAVYDAFEPIDTGDTWFMPDSDCIALLVGRAVPFVRTWPDAPIEALFLHTFEGVPRPDDVDVRWADLKPLKRMAWEVFHDTLISVDRIIGVERQRLLLEEASAVDIRRVPLDETTLETVDDPSDLTEIGRAMARREAASAD